MKHLDQVFTSVQIGLCPNAFIYHNVDREIIAGMDVFLIHFANRDLSLKAKQKKKKKKKKKKKTKQKYTICTVVWFVLQCRKG